MNKEDVIAFYELMFNECRPREAIERFAGAEYIQHNPLVADGKEPFIAYFEEMAREFPGKRVYVKRVEHWDVLQVVPSESRNGNTMF